MYFFITAPSAPFRADGATYTETGLESKVEVDGGGASTSAEEAYDRIAALGCTTGRSATRAARMTVLELLAMLLVNRIKRT